MTNEEAIAIIGNFPIVRYEDIRSRKSDSVTALTMAIEALKKQTAYICDGCKYEGRSEMEVPCCYCDRWGEDKYERSNDGSTI